MLNIVHVVNQFFAGLGGEDKADTPVGVLEQPSAVTRALQSQLGGQARVTATLYFGDNYFHEHTSEATDAILREIRTRKPQVIVAGPAFNSGRYGLACVEICNSIANEVEIPCVTAMHPENPAVSTYQDYHNSNLFLLPTSETAVGMARALGALAQFAWKMGSGIEIGSVQEEGYLPRGIRRLVQTDRPGAERAIDMLLKRVQGDPFVTEVPVQIWDHAHPAPPLADLTEAKIAIVTTSGVVPWGNPDTFQTYRNTFWRKYNIAEEKRMEPSRWEAVHGGYNTSFMNKNPDYGVPLDALRGLEADETIGKLHSEYYVVPGNQGAPSVMRQIGQEIAKDLRKEGVDGVLLVCT
jgi:glycine reductase